MAAEAYIELDPEVGVETATFLGYSDDRPTEAIFAGTSDSDVRYVKLNSIGEAAVKQALEVVFACGIEEVLRER